MAMPTDFWRNDQMLNIFRTKSCQRLARDGVCGWRSQCQFSHELEWPRRQPRRYNYSPEMCPNIRVIEDEETGTQRMENNCTAGLRCPFAHSKEEVLFHPHIFKTNLCEEHANNTSSTAKGRNAKKNRCHRYYCPFAHGNDELRTSPLPAEQRERCVRGMEVFPSDVCCVVCTRHWITPQATVSEKTYQEPSAQLVGPAFGNEVDNLRMIWGQKGGGAPSPPFPGCGGQQHPFDVLSTVPNLLPGHLQGDTLKPPKDIFAKNFMDKMAKDPSLTAIHSPTKDPFQMPPSPFMQDFNPSLFYGEPLGSSLRVSNLSHDSPAFIDISSNGYSVGQQLQAATKLPLAAPSSPEARDLLGEFYYAML